MNEDDKIIIYDEKIHKLRFATPKEIEEAKKFLGESKPELPNEPPKVDWTHPGC